jgi:hypothetical protein
MGYLRRPVWMPGIGRAVWSRDAPGGRMFGYLRVVQALRARV